MKGFIISLLETCFTQFFVSYDEGEDTQNEKETFSWSVTLSDRELTKRRLFSNSPTYKAIDRCMNYRTDCQAKWNSGYTKLHCDSFLQTQVPIVLFIRSNFALWDVAEWYGTNRGNLLLSATVTIVLGEEKKLYPRKKN